MSEHKGRYIFKKYESAINLLVKFYKLFPYKIRMRFLINMRDKKGKIAMGKRYALLKSCAKYVGKNVSIHPHVVLLNIRDLSVGDNVSIHPFCYIDAWGGVEIGNDVSISHGVSILSFEHNYGRLDIPIKDQGADKRPVSIDSDVWIGAKATILGNSVIESGCIIGANAVVKKRITKQSIAVGAPAHTVRTRANT